MINLPPLQRNETETDEGNHNILTSKALKNIIQNLYQNSTARLKNNTQLLNITKGVRSPLLEQINEKPSLITLHESSKPQYDLRNSVSKQDIKNLSFLSNNSATQNQLYSSFFDR